MADNQKHGILYDTLFHEDFPTETRNAIVTRMKALFATQIGQQVLADIDSIVTPSVFPYADLTNASNVSALIAHEAQRNFWTQLKAIRNVNVSGTKPNARPITRAGQD